MASFGEWKDAGFASRFHWTASVARGETSRCCVFEEGGCWGGVPRRRCGARRGLHGAVWYLVTVAASTEVVRDRSRERNRGWVGMAIVVRHPAGTAARTEGSSLRELRKRGAAKAAPGADAARAVRTHRVPRVREGHRWWGKRNPRLTLPVPRPLSFSGLCS